MTTARKTTVKRVAKPTMGAFSGKYAAIRKDFWKGTVGAKWTPEHYQFGTEYKTEAGFRNGMTKRFASDMAKIDRIENAGTVLDGTVSIRWTKGGQYGWQATASLAYTYLTPDGKILSKVVDGSRTKGAGYDKESTAFASAAEKSPEFVKILMDARAKKKDLGYGVTSAAGKPYFPHFNGGVGMGSIWRSMERAGYTFESVRTATDTVNVYQFRIKRKPAKR